MPIPIFDVRRQAKISVECAKLRDSTERTSNLLKRQLALLTERRQALITAAVTGQIDVTTARGVDVS
jgi:type I restriction enzyme S subunit